MLAGKGVEKLGRSLTAGGVQTGAASSGEEFSPSLTEPGLRCPECPAADPEKREVCAYPEVCACTLIATLFVRAPKWARPGCPGGEGGTNRYLPTGNGTRQSKGKRLLLTATPTKLQGISSVSGKAPIPKVTVRFHSCHLVEMTASQKPRTGAWLPGGGGRAEVGGPEGRHRRRSPRGSVWYLPHPQAIRWLHCTTVLQNVTLRGH